MRDFQLLIKYSLDFCLALLILIPICLVLLLLGIILYLDSPGAIFFCQLRPGKGGKLFKMYKLRTMLPGDHTATVPRNRDGSLALTNDLQGYTRFGKILRNTSLDELPQLFNILKGEMSFIGPRPDLPEHLKCYSKSDRTKLKVRPGMTGLAQVKGRNELPWKKRLRLDADYVEHYSLWQDLKILVATFGRILSRKGVYQANLRK